MQNRMSALLLSGAIGILVTGCATTTTTMRGQSPQGSAGSWETGCGNGECQGHGGGYGQNCNMCESGYGGSPMGCPPGSACQAGGACQNCNGQCAPCVNLPFHPVHRNFHTYDVPSGLSYPDQDQPAGVYQYPYYTTRGPTDFFMK